MQARTNVKAGGIQGANHNEAQVRPAGLRVQTGIKAGNIKPPTDPPPPPG
jgi:hypothetical protein